MYVIYLTLDNGHCGFYRGTNYGFDLYDNANDGQKFPSWSAALNLLKSLDFFGYKHDTNDGYSGHITFREDVSEYLEIDYEIYDLNELPQEQTTNNSSYQDLFLDIMNSINNIAKGYGFLNGSDWARTAYNICELSLNGKQQYDILHGLRNSCAHGHSNEVNINEKTYKDALWYLNKIKKSNARKYSRY